MGESRALNTHFMGDVIRGHSGERRCAQRINDLYNQYNNRNIGIYSGQYLLVMILRLAWF